MNDRSMEYAKHYYYSPHEWDKESPIRIVRGGETVTKPGYAVGPKRIECYSIHFVKEGSVRLDYGTDRITLSPGDVFCLFPNLTYVYQRVEQEKELEMCWLAVEGVRAEKLMHSIGFSPEVPYVKQRGSRVVLSILKQIHERMGRGVTPTLKSALEQQALLQQLLSLLMKDERTLSQMESRNWLRRSMEYMELHAGEGITVQQAAEEAGVNRTYFSMEFTKQVGVPPREYLTNLRMEKAKELLRETSASVTEIAYSLGYPSLFAFTRAFTKRCGLSPSAFRANV